MEFSTLLKKWQAEQNKILEEKLAVIREEQAEADKKALERKEAYELRSKRRDAEDKMKDLTTTLAAQMQKEKELDEQIKTQRAKIGFEL